MAISKDHKLKACKINLAKESYKITTKSNTQGIMINFYQELRSSHQLQINNSSHFFSNSSSSSCCPTP